MALAPAGELYEGGGGIPPHVRRGSRYVIGVLCVLQLPGTLGLGLGVGVGLGLGLGLGVRVRARG